jgi:hypothetical protein
VREAGKANQKISDDEVLAYATDNMRAVLTINRKDFIALPRQNTEQAGIIARTADMDFIGQAQRINKAITENKCLTGQLVRVYRSNR